MIDNEQDHAGLDTDVDDYNEQEEFVKSGKFDAIELEDIEEIAEDERKLETLKEQIGRGYAALCGLCKEPLEDADEEEDEEEDESEEHDATGSKDLLLIDQALALYEGDLPDLEMPKPKKVFVYDPDSDGDEKGDEDAEMNLSCRALFKKIKQASHPDKIMRFSAETKKDILQCFHDAKLFYEEEDLAALVTCYICVHLLRNEKFKITEPMWKLVKERHHAILSHMKHISELPYVKAIQAYYRGEKELAIKLFKAYLKKKKEEKDGDFDVSYDDFGDAFFEYDD